jgi:hypothetical protein
MVSPCVPEGFFAAESGEFVEISRNLRALRFAIEV